MCVLCVLRDVKNLHGQVRYPMTVSAFATARDTQKSGRNFENFIIPCYVGGLETVELDLVHM